MPTSTHPNLPTISVVTPSFNQAKFIRATVDSVLSQHYPHLEYWVIDGGSTDGTVDILKSYGKELHWLSEPDHGQTDAINKGFTHCTGDILAFLNSDDLYLPGTLQRVGEYFAAHKQAQWLTGDYEIIDGSGARLASHSIVSSYKSFLLRHYRPALLRLTNSIIPQPSTFWTRSAYEAVGELDESLRYCMDYDLWLRLAKKFPLHYLPVSLSAFRRHQDSKSETATKKQFTEELAVLKTHGGNHFELAVHQIHSLLTLSAYGFLK